MSEKFAKHLENQPNDTSFENPVSFAKIFQDHFRAAQAFVVESRNDTATSAYAAGHMTFARAFAGDEGDPYGS